MLTARCKNRRLCGIVRPIVMSGGSEERYTFDAFLLDCASGELRRGGSLIALRPKVYALLVYLLENHGRLIPKDEMIQAVWGDVHVGDGSLNRAIAELRGILGDDSRAPRLIETVPRRGYKFVGKVTQAAAQPAGRLSRFMLLTSDRTVPLAYGETIIGRTPECTVQIIGPSVSRRHARLFVSSEGATIEDLRSLNGTFVGDRRISEVTTLSDGDHIRIGKEQVRFLSDTNFRARTEPAL
jgi:DNA-binding winged helix-turn-helix (wHTH) protein